MPGQHWRGQVFAQHHKDDILAGEARVNVLHLDRERGPKQKVEEQVQQLKAMLQDSQPPLPEDVILNELGAAYEQLGRWLGLHTGHRIAGTAVVATIINDFVPQVLDQKGDRRKNADRANRNKYAQTHSPI